MRAAASFLSTSLGCPPRDIGPRSDVGLRAPSALAGLARGGPRSPVAPRAAVALAVLILAACGKYGPPVRTAPAPAATTPAVSAAPAGAGAEQCEDPNTPSSQAPASEPTP